MKKDTLRYSHREKRRGQALRDGELWEIWIKERTPEMESRRERHSGEKPGDGVTGRQRRER